MVWETDKFSLNRAKTVFEITVLDKQKLSDCKNEDETECTKDRDVDKDPKITKVFTEPVIFFEDGRYIYPWQKVIM